MRSKRAGVVAYRVGPGRKTKFLLITSSSNRDDWVLPKGHIEPGEDPPSAALRELMEEAGVAGSLIGMLGSVDYTRDGVRIEAAYFLVKAMREGRSPEGRRRRWLELEKALEVATHDTSKTLLERAAKRLGLNGYRR